MLQKGWVSGGFAQPEGTASSQYLGAAGTLPATQDLPESSADLPLGVSAGH